MPSRGHEEAQVDPLDGEQAAAEARLERLDDELLESGPASDQAAPSPSPDGVEPDGYGFHLDDPEADLLTEDADTGRRDNGEADAIEVLAEAFNARDLDALLDVVSPDGEAPGLLGYDRDNLPQAVEDLWTRRPSCMLTRGRADAEDVGVLWELDGTVWWRIAVVHVDDVIDGAIGVLEFTEDAALLEETDAEAPGLEDLEEGANWVEWDDGSEGVAPG